MTVPSVEPFAELKKNGLKYKPNYYLIFFGLAFFGILCGIVSTATISKALTLSYAAFFLGTIVEFRKIVGNWKNVILVVGLSLLISLMNFLPYKRETNYIFQNHVDNWPIVFSFILFTLIIAFNSKKIIAKVGEGFTLLHSLTFLYFIFEFFRDENISHWWGSICLLPVLYSLFHAFSHIEITKKDRLYLSLWSSITMFVFGFVYVKGVLQLDNVEKLIMKERFLDSVYILGEYFLLGASGVYIIHNVHMLIGYLPRRDKFFNKKYYLDVQELNKMHIERYSERQAEKFDSFIVFISIGSFLTANYFINFFSPSLAITLCLVMIPFLIDLRDKLINTEKVT